MRLTYSHSPTEAGLALFKLLYKLSHPGHFSKLGFLAPLYKYTPFSPISILLSPLFFCLLIDRFSSVFLGFLLRFLLYYALSSCCLLSFVFFYMIAQGSRMHISSNTEKKKNCNERYDTLEIPWFLTKYIFQRRSCRDELFYRVPEICYDGHTSL